MGESDHGRGQTAGTKGQFSVNTRLPFVSSQTEEEPLMKRSWESNRQDRGILLAFG